MIEVTVANKIGKKIPGYVASTNGTDGEKNAIAMAFFEQDGVLRVYCGRWDTTTNRYIPLEYLPAGCDSEDFLHTVTGN